MPQDPLKIFRDIYDEERPANQIGKVAQQAGAIVTSTTGGRHNRGSKHYTGDAADIRTRDKRPEEVEALKQDFTAKGYRVLDERQKPAGQRVWGGPHLHVEQDDLSPFRAIDQEEKQQPARVEGWNKPAPRPVPRPTYSSLREATATEDAQVPPPANRTLGPRIDALPREQTDIRRPFTKQINALQQSPFDTLQQGMAERERMLPTAPRQAPTARPVQSAAEQQAVQQQGPFLRGASQAYNAAAKGIARIPQGLAELADLTEQYNPLAIAGNAIQERISGVPAPKTATTLRPYTQAVEQAIDRDIPVDPNDQSWVTAKIPRAAGSVVPFLAGGLASGGSRAATALLGAAGNTADIASEFDQAGGDPAKRDQAIALAAATGLTEVFGVGKFLAKFGANGGMLQTAKTVLEEGGQEALQQWLNNVNAAEVGGYDPNRPQSQGVGESAALGGIVGGGVGAASGLAGRYSAPKATPEEIQNIRANVVARQAQRLPQATTAQPVSRETVMPPLAARPQSVDPLASALDRFDPPAASKPDSGGGAPYTVLKPDEWDRNPTPGYKQTIVKVGDVEHLIEYDPKQVNAKAASAKAKRDLSAQDQSITATPKPEPVKQPTMAEQGRVQRAREFEGIQQRLSELSERRKSVEGDSAAERAVIAQEMEQLEVARKYAKTPLEKAPFDRGVGALRARLRELNAAENATTAGLKASVKMFITRDEHQQLADLGYSRAQRAKMTPDEAQGILVQRGRQVPMQPEIPVSTPESAIFAPESRNTSAPIDETGPATADFTKMPRQRASQRKDTGDLSLESFVIRNGGVRRSSNNRGDVAYGVGREGGRPGFINDRSGIPVDVMRQQANEAGFGPYETEADFLSAMRDARNVFSDARRNTDRLASEEEAYYANKSEPLSGRLVQDAPRPLTVGEPIDGDPRFSYRGIDYPEDALSPDVSMQRGAEGENPFGWGGSYVLQIANAQGDAIPHHRGAMRGSFDPQNVKRIYFHEDQGTPASAEPGNKFELDVPKIAQQLQKLRQQFPQAEFVQVRLGDDAQSRVAEPMRSEYRQALGLTDAPPVRRSEPLPSAPLADEPRSARFTDDEVDRLMALADEQPRGNVLPFNGIRRPSVAVRAGAKTLPPTPSPRGGRQDFSQSAAFPREQRALVGRGREIEQMRATGTEGSGGYGRFAEQAFKSTVEGGVKGQTAFYESPNVKGALGLDADASAGQVREAFKKEFARLMKTSADEVSLADVPQSVWDIWMRRNGRRLGREDVRRYKQTIENAQSIENTKAQNENIQAEDTEGSKQGAGGVRADEGATPGRAVDNLQSANRAAKPGDAGSLAKDQGRGREPGNQGVQDDPGFAARIAKLKDGDTLLVPRDRVEQAKAAGLEPTGKRGEWRKPVQPSAAESVARPSVDDLARLQPLFDTLKQDAAKSGQSVQSAVDDYLKQAGLFGNELNPAQATALRQMAEKSPRAASTGQQESLLDVAPTAESKIEQQRQTIAQKRAQQAANKDQGPLFAGAKDEPRTVTHDNPDINGKPILATTADNRVVVPNENNKAGVSVVKDQGVKAKEPWEMTRDEFDAHESLLDERQKQSRYEELRLSESDFKTPAGNVRSLVLTGDMSFRVTSTGKRVPSYTITYDDNRSGFYRPSRSFQSKSLTDIASWANERVRESVERGRLELGGEEGHEGFIEEALRQGKSVPPEVLTDYPDLASESSSTKSEPGERYAPAKDIVDGLKVRKEIPNQDSIGATFDNYEVLPGVRVVSMSEFEQPPTINARTKALAQEIKNSGEINPLIVAVDSEGPYILEGGHRYDALKINGAKEFPALVVIEGGTQESVAPAAKTPSRAGTKDQGAKGKPEGFEPTSDTQATTEQQIYFERAGKPQNDIKRQPTGWQRVDTENGAALYDPQSKRLLRFDADNPRSGSDVHRARAKAQAYAMDNLPQQPESLPPGELEIKPIYQQSTPPRAVTEAPKGAEVIAAGAKSEPPQFKPGDRVMVGKRERIVTRHDQGSTTVYTRRPEGAEGEGTAAKLKDVTLAEGAQPEAGNSQSIIEKLDAAADAAKQRIRQRGKGRLSAGIDPADLTDHVIYGAAKLAKGAINFGEWSAQMVRELGENIRPHLQKLWDGAHEYLAKQPKESKPVFYSQLERALEAKMPRSASAEQVRGLLRNPQNGVKPEEAKWIGLDDFLRDKTTVTKQQVLDFVRANQVEVQEVEKGGEAPRFEQQSESRWTSPNSAFSIIKRGDKYRLSHATRMELSQTEYASLQEAKNAAIGKGKTDETTKFSQYTLPGAEPGSYRELLLTLPFRERGEIGQRRDRLQELTDKAELFESHGDQLTTAEYDELDRLINYLADQPNPYLDSSTEFKSSHFDEPNILAHVRFNDRTDADGKRVLFLEEVQSDWHQEGRKKGYRTSDDERRLKEAQITFSTLSKEMNLGVNDTLRLSNLDNPGLLGQEARRETRNIIASRNRNATSAEIDANVAKLKDSYQALREAERVLRQFENSTIPDAPFKKSWHELAFKRMLRYAAENGYDKLAWTTGEQQADRFDLSKHLDSIGWQQATKDGTYYLNAIDKQGNSVIEDKLVSRAKLPDVVGKEIADKIVEAENNGKGKGKFTGIDLKVGGEGMKGFYDKILPDFVNQYAKKWGAKVGESQIPQTDMVVRPSAHGDGFDLYSNESGTVIQSFATRAGAEKARAQSDVGVHSIDITPEMKDSVMQGQPRFSGLAPRSIEQILAPAAEAARQRIATRTGGIARSLPDYAIIGAHKIAAGAADFTDWSNQMVKDFGRGIKPHLQQLWTDAQEHLAQQNQLGQRQGRRERGAVVNPFAGRARKSAENLEEDYRGQHEAPMSDSGSPLHDLTDTYPADIYSAKAREYYGHYGDARDAAAISIIQSMKGKPNARVTVYRAVPAGLTAKEQLATLTKQMAAFMRRGVAPDGSKGRDGSAWYNDAYAKLPGLTAAAEAEGKTRISINPGDFVTIDRRYAVEHGQSALNGKYKILSKTVAARDIFTNGDSIQEWGYDPQLPTTLGTKNREAGAARNPPAQRTREDVEQSPEFQRWFRGSRVTDDKGKSLVVYHGTGDDITAFDPKHSGAIKDAFFFTDNPEDAGKFTGIQYGVSVGEGANIMPVYLALKNPKTVAQRGEFNFRQLQRDIATAKSEGHDGLIVKTVRNFPDSPKTTTYVAFKDTQIKSATGNSGQFDSANPDVRYSGVSPHAFRQLDDAIAKLAGQTQQKVPVPGTFTTQKFVQEVRAAIADRDLTPKQKAEAAAIVDKVGAAEAAGDGAELVRQQRAMADLLTKHTWLADPFRPLMAAGEWSFIGLQGAQQIISNLGNPRALKDMGRALLKSSTRLGFDNLVAEMRNHPRSEEALKAGLALSSQKELKIMRSGYEREEAFHSRIADLLPGLPMTNRQMTGFLDSQRLQAYDGLASMLNAQGHTYGDQSLTAPERAKINKKFEMAAEMANTLTGRGDFGKFLSNNPAIGSVLGFGPRWVASRFQLMNPNFYVRAYKADPQLAKQAGKEALKLYAAWGSVLAAGAVAGFDISLDPDDPDFLKLKRGNYRLDVSMGMRAQFRIIAQMVKRMAEATKFESTGKRTLNPLEMYRDTSMPTDEVIKKAFQNVAHYGRTKLSPLASLAPDFYFGKNMIGEKVTPKDAIQDRVVPIFWKGVYDAYKEEGAGKAARQLPNAIGLQGSEYERKSARPASSTRPAGRRLPVAIPRPTPVPVRGVRPKV